MRACPSFPGYLVSDDGVVISLRRRLKPLILRHTIHRKGYHLVAVATPNGQRSIGVHVLVADAFIGPRPSSTTQVRHLDGNPHNNRANNILYGTPAQNAADRQRHGRYARGAQHHNSRLTEGQAMDILVKRAAGQKVKALALEFGVSRSTVEDLIYRKQWKHLEFRRVE